MARYSRFAAFERLSEEGKIVVLRGIEEDWTQAKIQTELAKATGEAISNGALGRFVQNWRQQSQQMDRLEKSAARVLQAAKQNDVEAEELGANMIALGLMAQEDNVGGMDPKDLLRLQRDYVKLGIQRKKLELDAKKVETMERELALKEKQLEDAKAKERRVAEELERAAQAAEKGKGLSADALRRIRELYGLEAAA